MKTKVVFSLFLMGCWSLSLFSQINSNSPAKPFASNLSYSYGIMPTNLPSGVTYGKSQDAGNAYNAWKQKFVQACTGKGSRILYDDMSSTVSEGIAYGMLLAAYAGDKPLFDGLWQFYKASVNGKGVMHWKYSSCTSITGYNGATDAELDAALALLVAEDQWPTSTTPYDYKAEATSLISKIRQYEIHPTSYQTLNGDAWGTTNDCRNPSYFAPAYYRLYATVETSQASFWNSTVTATNSFLLTNRNSTTGLVGNWAGSNGVSNGCNGPAEYGWDACRNPWRMATDVLWNGSTSATTASDICNKVANWVKGNENNMKGPLAQNASNPSVGQYKEGAFSTYALAIMGTSATNQNSLNTAYTAVVNLGNNGSYFNATLRCITLFMMSGNFWKPGQGGTVTLPTTPVVSATDGTSCDNSTVSWGAVAGATSYKIYKNGTLQTTQTTTSYVDANAPAVDATVTSVGYSATGCKDDFNSTTDYALGATGKGLFWWKPADAPGIYTLTRDSVNKKLSVAVVQPKGSYKPFGVSFGDTEGDGTGTPYTADMSGDFTYLMTVKNNGSTDVAIRLAAQDISSNVIDLNSNPTPVGDAWKHNIDMIVPAGGSQTIKVGTINSQGVALSGTFNGGTTVDWTTTPPTVKTTFDQTKVKGINVTALSTQQDPVTYEPLAWSGSIDITSFAVGKFATSGTGTPAEYCVEACNANGCSPKGCDNGYKKECSITIPTAPATVNASDGTSCDNVSVTWSASAGATSYKIYRGTTLLSTVTSTSYTDAAAPTTATNYCVEALNSAGTSAQTCNTGYKGTNCATLPATPTGVSATDGTLCDKSTITWNAVSGATSYNVYKDGTLLGNTTTNTYDDPNAPLSDGGAVATTAGYSATGCMDDFKSETDYAIGTTGKGLFWWSPADAPGIYTITRNYAASKLDVAVVQPKGSFKPFGVSFGDSNGDGTGTPYTIDCSGDFTYNMTVVNTSANDVFIRLAAQDVNGNVLDLNSSPATAGDAWKHNIDMLIGSGSSQTLKVGTLNSQSIALSGTFVGAATADWTTTPPTIKTTFDATKVKGFNVTVLSTQQDPVTYEPLALTGSVSITAFDMGNFVPTSGGTTPPANYCVEAVNASGKSAQACNDGYKGTGCTTTPPSTPTGVSATDGTSCDNVTISWNAVTTATSYKVYKAGTLLTTTTTTSYIDAAAATSSTQYCVEAINAGGTSAQACDNGNKGTGCTTNNAPVACFTASPSSGNAPLAVSFNASCSYDLDSDPLTYSWSFGNGQSGSGSTASQTFSSAGTYIVTLTVSDGKGGQNQTTQSVQVNSVVVSSDLFIEYYISNTQNNAIGGNIKVVNNGTTAVPYGDLKIRYWYLKEGSATEEFACYYAAVGSTNISATYNTAATPTANADSYMEISIAAAAGDLAASGNSGDIQIASHFTDWSAVDNTNDYSYDATKTTYAAWNRITLYQNGKLVWGVEPGGSAVNVKEIANDLSDVNIYPNPASSVVTIHGCKENSSISIYDIVGKKVLEQKLTASHTMNVSSLKKGVYFITVKNEQEQITKRLIKE